MVETIRISQACLFDIKGPIWAYFCSVTHTDNVCIDVYVNDQCLIDQYIS